MIRCRLIDLVTALPALPVYKLDFTCYLDQKDLEKQQKQWVTHSQ